MSGFGAFEMTLRDICVAVIPRHPPGGVWPVYANNGGGRFDGKRYATTTLCGREQWIIQWGFDDNYRRSPGMLS